MTTNRLLTIILPSYNDDRVKYAIQSIRFFDDIDTVKILVIDGGSSGNVLDLIRANLNSHDIFISEPDKGIFDALNKGLELCETKYIGWLGTDDMFTGKVLASEVIEKLVENELFIANIDFFRDGFVTRRTFSYPPRIGLMKLGFHNPHYATFGSAKLLKTERFDLNLKGSDIKYFLDIFNKKPSITSSNVVCTLQGEGGFSNSSQLEILRINLELIPLFGFLGPFSIICKLTYKFISKCYFKVFRRKVSCLFPIYD